MIDDESSDVEGVIDPRKRKKALALKVVLIIVHALTAAAQIGVAAASSSVTFNATIVGLGRTGVIDDSGTPGFEVVQHSTIDVALVFGLTNLFAVSGLLLALFFHRYELDAIQRGAMPFVWVAILCSAVPLFLGVELTAGIGLWTELWSLGALIGATLFIYWLGTHANVRGLHDYSWAYQPMALLSLVPLIVTILNAASVKYSNGGPGAHLVVAILAVAALCLAPLLILLIHLRVILTTPYAGLLALYTTASLTVLTISWSSFGVFAADGIAY